MRTENIKTPLTKPATPVSKRSDQIKATVNEGGQGIATIEQSDAPRVSQLEQLPDSDVELVEEEGADPQGAEKDSAPTADV